MDKTNGLKGNSDAEKGQKIAAALYLITAHLPESDPLRIELRECAVDLSVESASEGAVEELKKNILSLLHMAVLARQISENNHGILEAELKYLGSGFEERADLSTLFPRPLDDKGQFLPKRTYIKDMSFITQHGGTNVLNTIKNDKDKRNKTGRQTTILSFINDRKSATIKDISLLFPDVSEKTIQRELGILVSAGKIRRHGNKRWSLYLPIEA